MILDDLCIYFKRNLTKLIEELNAYVTEGNMWLKTDEINNSTGNLALHIIGNLQWFVGAQLGKTVYKREREKEFTQKNITRTIITEGLENTLIMLEQVLSKFSLKDLDKPFPIELFGKPCTNGFMLMHLSTHLAYHLGQINYHRRLLDK
jgi:hypothetical protein